MAKFIKLVGVWGPDDPTPVGAVHASVDHIAGFMRPDFHPVLSPEGGEQVTLVLLSGGDKDNPSDVYVSETPEQILALIEAAKES